MLSSNLATAKKANRGKLSLAACLLLAKSVMAETSCKLLLDLIRCSRNSRIGRSGLDLVERSDQAIAHGRHPSYYQDRRRS